MMSLGASALGRMPVWQAGLGLVDQQVARDRQSTAFEQAGGIGIFARMQMVGDEGLEHEIGAVLEVEPEDPRAAAMEARDRLHGRPAEVGEDGGEVGGLWQHGGKQSRATQ
jgi:hypothetical protein